MAASLLITLREGMEAALIVAIVLAALKRLGRADLRSLAWAGVGTASAVAAIAGAALFVFAGGLPERAEEIFEGAAMFAATGVLTYMVFWMARHGQDMAAGVDSKASIAAQAGSKTAVFLLAFVAVLREGLETALFLFTTVQAHAAVASLGGAVLGLAIAAAVGYVVYATGLRLSLRSFFAVTSFLLLLVAAGLAAHGANEFQKAGLLPQGDRPVYDLAGLLPQDRPLGSVLREVFGYADSPTSLEVIVYFAYLAPALLAWARRRAPARPPGRDTRALGPRGPRRA